MALTVAMAAALIVAVLALSAIRPKFKFLNLASQGAACLLPPPPLESLKFKISRVTTSLPSVVGIFHFVATFS